MTSAPRISVVVTCADGTSTLPATLAALEMQTLRRVAEIIVVDEDPSDAPRAAEQTEDVRSIHLPHGSGVAAAYNAGWRAARGPLVAFTDDCRPREDWLARLVTTFAEHPYAAGVGGSVTVAGTDSFATRYLRRNNPHEPLENELTEMPGLADRLRLYLKRCAGTQHPDGTRPVSSLVAANMAFRASALEAVDGFDERFPFGSEEDLCRRLQRTVNHEGPEPDPPVLWFSPAAIVDHDFRPDLADTLRRSRTYGRGNAQMFLKHTAEQTPVVYPLPIIVAGLLVTAMARRRVWPAAAAACLPSLLFSRWLRGAAQERSAEMLLYPYVQLAQETYNNVGMGEALLRERSPFARGSTDC